MKGPIQSMEVSYLVHATEDQGKLAEAVAELFGAPFPAESEALEGHFGNRIVMARHRITGSQAEAAAAKMFAAVPIEVAKDIRANIEGNLDEHSALFLRFDKQELVRGRLALGGADPVRVKIKPRLFMVGRDPVGFYTRLIEGR